MPEASRYHWVVDNNRTHSTPAVCALVAELSGLATSEGLVTGKARRQWLSDPEHKHVFHFTPVHGSWLNQVELFFSVLSRKLLKRDDFASEEAFVERLVQWLDFYNKEWAHPYKWTYGACKFFCVSGAGNGVCRSVFAALWPVVLAHDREAVEGRRPAHDRHRPPLRCCVNRQVHQLQRQCRVGELLAIACALPDHAVDRLDHVRRVDRLADRWREVEQDAVVRPLQPPLLDKRRIFLPPHTSANFSSFVSASGTGAAG